jgi:hypothetical protein
MFPYYKKYLSLSVNRVKNKNQKKIFNTQTLSLYKCIGQALALF